MADHRRDLIFISHATPEDNDFSLWLSTRLTLMGYQVWSDVTQLFGGEKWWEDIGEAIDQYTCKFILVITSTSLTKPGVQKEISLALAAEEKHQLTNFIIPIIIDSTDFSGQPYGLSERNIIPFCNGWGPALGKLLERMTRDNVPTTTALAEIGQKLMDLTNPEWTIEHKPDLIVSNWLELASLPEFLQFYRIPVDPKLWRKNFESCPYPWFEWSGFLVSFAEAEVFRQSLPRHISVTQAPTLDLGSLLSNKPRNHITFSRTEVFKWINYLILESWALKMKSVGLYRYDLSGGKVAWYFPENDNFGGMKQFADVFGVLKKKKVIGFSPKNNVFWHYAIEVKALYGSHARIILIPHVVFTTDGLNPLQDKARMHRLRRGFCANWWNDRWRDLMLVYLNLVAEDQNVIEVPIGRRQSLIFSSRPTLFGSDFSLVNTEIGDAAEEAIDNDDFDVVVSEVEEQ
ncbi:toll/interleukin-1 receptor domain-containing protein [Pseudohongiella acticola]|jgi:TIR domain|uniref:toll/interleukin-1 receptor domain-containing protein n=1 Tax=Pseudohongiella acticola TaxID=1524254 RepID=UPI0030EB13AD